MPAPPIAPGATWDQATADAAFNVGMEPQAFIDFVSSPTYDGSLDAVAYGTGDGTTAPAPTGTPPVAAPTVHFDPTTNSFFLGDIPAQYTDATAPGYVAPQSTDPMAAGYTLTAEQEAALDAANAEARAKQLAEEAAAQYAQQNPPGSHLGDPPTAPPKQTYVVTTHPTDGHKPVINDGKIGFNTTKPGLTAEQADFLKKYQDRVFAETGHIPTGNPMNMPGGVGSPVTTFTPTGPTLGMTQLKPTPVVHTVEPPPAPYEGVEPVKGPGPKSKWGKPALKTILPQGRGNAVQQLGVKNSWDFGGIDRNPLSIRKQV